MQWISNVSNDTCYTSQFSQATFQVLNCCMWPVATVLDSATLQDLESSKINDMHSIKVLVYKSYF